MTGEWETLTLDGVSERRERGLGKRGMLLVSRDDQMLWMEYGVRRCESFRGKWIVIRKGEGRGGEERGVVPPHMVFGERYRTVRGETKDLL